MSAIIIIPNYTNWTAGLGSCLSEAEDVVNEQQHVLSNGSGLFGGVSEAFT